MTWFLDGRTIARKVKNPTDSAYRHGGRGRSIECPSCGHVFGQSNGTLEWPGLPAGVKFDPSDQELLQHLAAKAGLNGPGPHPFIDEFIPTLDEEDGICYTHPEKLPGIRPDGSSIHFFHRPAKAYTTGTRKRRKIQMDEVSRIGGEMRWHKTGKTRPVVDNGNQLGCKKIMVLYVNFGKNAKPDKTNWVMHQYHLGEHEEEKEGELVVSKVFYQTQPRQSTGMRKGEEEDCVQVELEVSDDPACSIPQSSASVMSTSFNSREMPPKPMTPIPLLPQTAKQPKGLLETICEDVNRLNASVNCGSIGQISEQTAAFHLVQGSPDLGERDTGCSLVKNNVQNECEAQAIGECVTGLQMCHVHHTSEGSALGSHQFSDTPDGDLMKLLCNENLQADWKFKNKDDAAQSLKNIAAEIGFKLDTNVGDGGITNVGEGGVKADSALENIILDTPPDFSLESLINSQEFSEWLGKRKFWSDSQKTSGSDDLLDFLRNSQSST